MARRASLSRRSVGKAPYEPKLVKGVQPFPSGVVGGDVEFDDLLGGQDPVLMEIEQDSAIPFLDLMHDRHR